MIRVSKITGAVHLITGGDDRMQVRLLGPVEVAVAGGSRPVPGLRRKAVLAVLALRAGEVVSTDWLIDVVWGAAAPSTAVNTLQRHVSHLRGVLGSRAAIRARPPGYVLDLGADPTDVAVAERLIERGTGPVDADDRVRQLRAALALWRGRPLVDVAGPVWLEEQADRLDRLRLRGLHALNEARLALGEYAELVPELQDLVRDRPLDEEMYRQLMLALYGSGRQAEALAVYQRLRRMLVDELGIDPGQPVRELEAAILRQDPDLVPGVPSVTLPAVAAVPAQLPLAVGTFVGRQAQLDRLDDLLSGTGPTGVAMVSVVAGTAGAGKTTLVVHWAHRVAARFPDGQLFVNLRGFDPVGSAVDPGEALRGFLDAFGVPSHRVPGGLQAQVGLYRSLLAGKRVLVVLDSARDVDQVRPLLPASAGCVAVVTSRDQLTGLVAAEGARPLVVDLLGAGEARALLAGRLGAARVAGDPAAVDRIIERCARLPLALVLAAARAAIRPEFPLAVLADELRDAVALDTFGGGDPASDVRAVFSCSYRTLGAGAARLFRLLGEHPGPDIGELAAASLAGVELADAHGLLAELARIHMVTEHRPGRYTLHDLLLAYAAHQARLHDAVDARRAAVCRVLDHYLQTARAAIELLGDFEAPPGLVAPAAGVVLNSPLTKDSAAAWFVAERPVLLAAVELAATAGFDAHAMHLGLALGSFLDQRGYWRDEGSALAFALGAARRLGDSWGQAHCHRAIAHAEIRVGHYESASAHADRAIGLFERLGDPAQLARTVLVAAQVYERRGRCAEALSLSEWAAELYGRIGHRVGQARALNAVGWCLARLGEYGPAVERCRTALDVLRELGDLSAEAATLDSIGFAQQRLGELAEAVDAFHRAARMLGALGHRYAEADVLVHLGDCHQMAGDGAAARRAWRRALVILGELYHPDADRVRAKLRSVTRDT